MALSRLWSLVETDTRSWSQPLSLTTSSSSHLFPFRAVQIHSPWSGPYSSLSAQFCMQDPVCPAVTSSSQRHSALWLLGTGPGGLPIHSMIPHDYLPWRRLAPLLLKTTSEGPGISYNGRKKCEGQNSARVSCIVANMGCTIGVYTIAQAIILA